MTQADSVLSTPPTNTSLPEGLLAQDRDRQTALRTLAKLRLEARDEIERLLTFLDESDPYVMTECEPDLTGYSTGMDSREGDDCDLEEPHDAEEDRADNEPSLGWTERGVFGDAQDMELA